MSENWYTPAHVVESIRRALGRIDLDPFSCAEANATVGAARFIDVVEDGLRSDWRGALCVLANPPFGDKLPLCLLRVIDHVAATQGAIACVIVPDNTDTKWWHMLAGNADRIVVMRGRVSFIDATEGNRAANTKGTHIAIIAHDAEAGAGVASALARDVRGALLTVHVADCDHAYRSGLTRELAAYRAQQRLL